MEAWHIINRNISLLYRSTHALMGKLLEPLGLGQGQYPYIIAVCRQPGISQDKLTSQLLFNKSSVARAVAQLEQGRFLYREPDPADKRSYRLYPTPKGEAALVEVFAQLEAASERLTAGLTPEETEQAASLLARMAANVMAPKPPRR